jgi:hypothetical protein
VRQIALAALFSLPSVAFAAPSERDTTFGLGLRKIITLLSGFNEQANAVATFQAPTSRFPQTRSTYVEPNSRQSRFVTQDEGCVKQIDAPRHIRCVLNSTIHNSRAALLASTMIDPRYE